MYVQLNGTWLTNANDGTSETLVTSSRELALNGKSFVQEADFLRAVAAMFYARGNRSNVLTFKTTRRFTTLASAFSFAMTHGDACPTSGPLILICGLPSEGQIQVSAVNGVLEGTGYSTSDGDAGVTVTHGYSIKCGALQSNGAPATIGYDGGPMSSSYTSPTATLDGGNMADTFIGCPTVDGGVLV